MVAKVGIEPTSLAFQASAKTTSATSPCERGIGNEPTSPTSTGRCSAMSYPRIRVTDGNRTRTDWDTTNHSTVELRSQSETPESNRAYVWFQTS